MKKIIFVATLTSIVISLGTMLNPLNNRMFSFHDATQAARIQQMAINIKQGFIPPRLAPDLSFGLGFPVFNFYAPTAYWITTFLHLTGIPIVMVLKLSFLLSLIFSCVATFLLLSGFFGFFSSLLGAVVYASSLWFAIEIFVRGNLAETWFLALFPLSLFFLYKNSQKNSSRLTFLFACFIVSSAISVHNILSLIALIIFVFFALLLSKKRNNLFAILIALGLASYFLFPAVFEANLTFASQIAKKTDYQAHFLCLYQIWSSPKWEFGGSGPGCIKDGMPFTLGKIHLILAGVGIILFLKSLLQRDNSKLKKISLFIFLVGAISVFLTVYQSQFVWKLFEPILSLFQFPWRMLVFVMTTIAYFSAYFSEQVKKKSHILSSLFVITMILLLLTTSKKFFSKPWTMSYNEYTKAFLEERYVKRTVAYNMAEYLPKTADYEYWRSFDSQIHPNMDMKIDVDHNTPLQANINIPYKVLTNNHFLKEIAVDGPGTVTINLHYFPFWKISVDGAELHPEIFDKLGRPIIKLTRPSHIKIQYAQTPIEHFGNLVTVITGIFLTLLLLYKPLWNKYKRHLK